MSTKRRFDAITFDCFGTLVDWETGILSAMQPLLTKHGKSVEDHAVLETYAKLESGLERDSYRPYRDVLIEIVDGFGKKFGFSPDTIERTALASSICAWPVFPDTIEALEQLKKSYKLGIISNIDDDLFKATAKRLRVSFDWVVTAQQARAYKPSHKVFDTAFSMIDLPKERLLHAAQSLFHDIGPARELGLANVWINRRSEVVGPGATPASSGIQPDREFPNLKSFAAQPE